MLIYLYLFLLISLLSEFFSVFGALCLLKRIYMLVRINPPHERRDINDTGVCKMV